MGVGNDFRNAPCEGNEASASFLRQLYSQVMPFTGYLNSKGLKMWVLGWLTKHTYFSRLVSPYKLSLMLVLVRYNTSLALSSAWKVFCGLLFCIGFSLFCLTFLKLAVNDFELILAKRCNCIAEFRYSHKMLHVCRMSVCNASVLWQNNCK